MGKNISQIEVPSLDLSHCSVEEHCQALRELKELSFWWYQGVSKVFGNYSLPFQDRNGNWWYQVKPGLCWAADCFRPMEPSEMDLPFAKTFFGFQHVVSDEADANSHLVINAIRNLQAYGPSSINAKRRNAVRKGFGSCTLEVVSRLDHDILDGCRKAWNDLSSRTGWKHALDKTTFEQTWKVLAECPGVSIITGRDKKSGEVAGFLVTKIIGDTAYVDTIASRSDLMTSNVNDAVMYAFLMNAAKLPGVSKGHYAIKSNVVTLERFKTGLGFEPYPFPARTCFRLGIGTMLKLCFRAKYNRMMGWI